MKKYPLVALLGTITSLSVAFLPGAFPQEAAPAVAPEAEQATPETAVAAEEPASEPPSSAPAAEPPASESSAPETVPAAAIGGEVPAPAAAAEPAPIAPASRWTEVPASSRLKVQYFYRLGLQDFEKGNFDGSARAMEEVLRLNPSYRRASYYYQEAMNRLGAPPAEPPSAEGEPISDQKIYDAYARGRQYLRYARYADAVREFQAVLDIYPDHQGAKELLAQARLKIEQQAFEQEALEAQKIADEEETLRALAAGEETTAVEEAYEEGRDSMARGDLEEARRSFTEIRKKEGRYRRTNLYLRQIEKDLLVEREKDKTVEEMEAIRKYTLGPEDMVRIIVRNHPEFSFNAEVEEGGELIVPLTNEIIMAKGLNRDELAEEIRKRLTAYIDNPFVNVFIDEYASKKFYVLQPSGGGGEYIMDKANMTLWDCMFQAGIPQLGASAMRRVQIITPDRTHPTHRWINVYAMLYQGKMEDNIRIDPGTIIYYPQLAIDKFTDLLKAITKPLTALTDLGDTYEDWDDFRKEYLK